MADQEKMKELKRELLSEVDSLMDRLIAERMGIPMGEEDMEMGMEEEIPSEDSELPPMPEMGKEPGMEDELPELPDEGLSEEPGMEEDMEMSEEDDLNPGFMDMINSRKKEDEDEEGY